jgi:hypothetical protein
MSTLMTIAVAAIVGVALAVSASLGVVSAFEQTPTNTATVEEPLLQYGNR